MYDNISETIKQEFLNNVIKDFKKSYKTRKTLYDYNLKYGKKDKANRLLDCGSVVSFYEKDGKQITLTNSCKQRFCPTCEKNSALDRFLNCKRIIENNDIKENLFHIIFTIKNCKGPELRDSIKKLSAAIRTFFRHYKIENFTRRIEVTYNRISDEYHPHAHCIVNVQEDSILNMQKIPRELFIERLRELRIKWCNICKGQGIYTGHFDYQDLYIRKLKSDKDLIECVKYACKPNSINDITVSTLSRELNGLKLFNGSGIFRTIKENNSTELKEIIDKPDKYVTYVRGSSGYKIASFSDCTTLRNATKSTT